MKNKPLYLTLLCVFSAIMALTIITFFSSLGIALGGLTPIATGIVASIFSIAGMIPGSFYLTKSLEELLIEEKDNELKKGEK
ncbi:hypothetical protein [Vreelandella neptunia]|jgi:hypothetical protein|uniref:Uncharacterized protein n=1 Tax=Vreelandella neptunia TaxID=115551 RepID=A0ABS9SA94_9GAMM|nr:hypothetical protein [Halomonas neptunia]MCH4812868.1 hypothetical protein [Halomonas neptunia]